MNWKDQLRKTVREAFATRKPGQHRVRISLPEPHRVSEEEVRAISDASILWPGSSVQLISKQEALEAIARGEKGVIIMDDGDGPESEPPVDPGPGRLPEAQEKCLREMGISGGSLAVPSVRSRLADQGLLREEVPRWRITKAGLDYLSKRGFDVDPETMTAEEVDQAITEWKARHRGGGGLRIDFETAAQDLMDSIRKAQAATAAMRDAFFQLAMESEKEETDTWRGALRSVVSQACQRALEEQGTETRIYVGHMSAAHGELLRRELDDVSKELGVEIVADDDGERFHIVRK